MLPSIALKRSLSDSQVEPASSIPSDGIGAAGPGVGSILPLCVERVSYAAEGRKQGTTVVLGANGAGKSLLLRLCHGLLRPTAGQVRWLGPCAAQANRLQAMVFQRPVLLRRSAAANIAYALRLRRIGPAEQKNRLQRALEMTGLTQLANQYARSLSGGEQQRLTLARAWASQPEVLFLDEPTAFLDPAATRSVEEIIRLFRVPGTKIIMTTHDLGQARRLADEILFLHHGRLVERSSADVFFSRPVTAEAQAFIRGELLW